MKNNLKKSALSRGLAILNYFDVEHNFAKASELSSQFGIPRASLHRILNELMSCGLIDYSPRTKLYSLSPKILEFTRSFYRSSNLIQIARPFISKIQEETSETASMHIIIEDERICVEEVPSRHNLHWSVPPGRRGPLYAGAAGTVLLAFMNPIRMHEILEEIKIKPLARNTPSSVEELLGKISVIRDLGYAISEEEHYDGVAGIAAPVLDENGNSIASITVSVPMVRWNDKFASLYVPLIVESSHSVSSILALRQPGFSPSVSS
jgi:IclR family transcriptional regulator, KDG regulon repressor